MVQEQLNRADARRHGVVEVQESVLDHILGRRLVAGSNRAIQISTTPCAR
jgi:hypothetical protein